MQVKTADVNVIEPKDLHNHHIIIGYNKSYGWCILSKVNYHAPEFHWVILNDITRANSVGCEFKSVRDAVSNRIDFIEIHAFESVYEFVNFLASALVKK